METEKPFVGLQNASDAREKRIAKEAVREVIKDFLWSALGYSICAVALLSIGYRLAGL